MLPLTKIIAIPKIHLGMLVNSETASTTNFFNDEYALSAITNYTLGSLDAVINFLLKQIELVLGLDLWEQS